MRSSWTSALPAAATALVVAAGVFAGLLIASRPAGADEKMAAIEATMQKAEALSRTAAKGASQQAGLCTGSSANEAQRFLSRAKTEAGAVELRTASAEPVAAPAGAPSQIKIALAGAGSQEAVSGFLAELAAGQPTVFVDALDLSPDRGRVAFQLRGSLWCRPTNARS